eukprot:UN07648
MTLTERTTQENNRATTPDLPVMASYKQSRGSRSLRKSITANSFLSKFNKSHSLSPEP